MLYNHNRDNLCFLFCEVAMRSEEEIRKIDAYLTCPKLTVEEHAHNISTLSWVLDVSDKALSDMIRDSEMSFSE